MIKTILLDYGGILAYPLSGNWFIPYNIMKIAGIGIMANLIFKKKRLNLAFFAGNDYLKSNHKLFTEEEEYEQFKEFYRIVFGELKIRTDEKTLAQLAKSIVFDDNQVKFYDGVKDELAELKEQYKLIVVSESWPSVKRVMENNDIFRLLDGLVLSCNHNKTKGTGELFETAIKEYNLIPDECVYIDDELKYMENAEKTGLKPILMDRRGEVTEADYPIIKHMDEIRDAIEAVEQSDDETETE